MIDNYKNERFKNYDTIEKAIIDLKEYVENDCLYEEYLDNRNAIFNDLEILNINHTKAIIKLLEEYKKIKEEMENKTNE